MNKLYQSVLLTIAALFSVSLCIAQQTFVNREWVTTSPAVADPIYHTSTVVLSGYLYTTGNKINGSSNTDIYTLKINAHTGDTVWSKTLDGTATGAMDYGVDIRTSSDGYVYVLGATQTNGAGYDYCLIKYSQSNGAQSWARKWNGPGNGDDVPSALLVDGTSAIYMTGGTEASNGFSDYGTVKVDNNNNLKWVKTYDYNSLHDGATTVSKVSGKIVVSGGSASTVGDWDIATLSYDPTTGATIGTTRTNVTGATMVEAKAMTTDLLNNIYITGYAVVSGEKNIQTVKLDSNLSLVYIVEYTSGTNNDCGNDVAVDANGNAYVVGYNELNSGGKNFITIKYNSSGTQQWVREAGNVEALQTAEANAVTLSDDNAINLIGTVVQSGTSSMRFVRYDEDGTLKVDMSFSSDSIDYAAYNIADASSDIYITGLSHTSGIYRYTVAKLSIFDKDQPMIIQDSVPYRVDDELLIRFDPDDLLMTRTDDTKITWGIVGDFLEPHAVDSLAAATGFDFEKLRCYKVFPNHPSSFTYSISRFGDTVVAPPFYATFGVILPPNSNDSIVADTLNETPANVWFAGYNGYVIGTATANDSYYTAGHFAGLEPTVAIDSADINVGRAWDYASGESSVVVGVYDSGINNAHADFSQGTLATSSVTDGYDYKNSLDLNATLDPDNHGHGSCVAGLIGAWRNNNFGVAGIAGGDDGTGGISLHDMKFYDAVDTGCLEPAAPLNVIFEAIVDGATGSGQVSTKQDIQNHSWQINFPPNFLLRETFIFAYHLGVIPVCASGNNGGPSSCSVQVFPGNYPDHMILQIGANDETGERADFSNCPTNNLDMIAPGVHGLYIAVGHLGDNFAEGEYWFGGFCGSYFDGTSMAAPHAAGTAALMLSYCETNSLADEFSLEDCEYLMQENVTDLVVSPNSPGPDQETGHGRLNAGNTFDHLWYPKYIIEHHAIPYSIDNATLVGYHEETCLEQSIYGLPAGAVIIVNRYEYSATGSHTQPTGYNLLDGWARGSASENVIGIASSSTALVSCSLAGNDYFLPAEWNPTMSSFTTTSATMTGYTYEILDFSGNHLGWWPVDTNDIVRFEYTLYWENPLLNGLTEENTSSFSIYPNPTNSSCTIQMNGDITGLTDIILLDVTGQMVMTIGTSDNLSAGNSVIFDVSGLSPGIYFVAVRTEEKNLIQKLIIGQ